MNTMMTMPSMALVPLAAVTHTAQQSGDWTDPATWGGTIPTDWAHVHVPEGITVRVDAVIPNPAKTLRVDGTLSFAPDTDTTLRVDTLVTTQTGHLQIGTAEAPIAPDVTARVIFADDGVIDRSWDPALISRGALLHGKTTINGAEKSGHAALAEGQLTGATEITLTTVPTGWQVGDVLVIAGTDPTNPESDETVTITAIDGTTLRFDTPLLRDHTAPRADLEVHVANLSRNVQFSSENEAAGHRGHLMVMHTNDAQIAYASFDDMGRSDKLRGYDDHEFVDLSPHIDPIILGGDNVRGRYSVHFHKGGTDKDGTPAKVTGSVVTDEVGWGFVNHSSNVEFIDNVAYNIPGAGYFTEAGDEIGAFIGNIALRIVNPDKPLLGGEEVDPDAREGRQDYGFQGDGFWFHGPNVRVEDNVVTGATGHAYIWWPEGLLEKTAAGTTSKVLHDSANVPGGDLIGPDGTLMQIHDVPIGSFTGNQGYATTKGVQIFYLHTEFFGDDLHTEDGTTMPPDAYFAQLRSTLSDTTIWNVLQSGFAAPYANRLKIENLKLVGTGAEETVGLDLSHFLNNIDLVVDGLEVDGFGTAVRVTTDGDVQISGEVLTDNTRDVQRVTPDEDGGRDAETGELIQPFGQDPREAGDLDEDDEDFDEADGDFDEDDEDEGGDDDDGDDEGDEEEDDEDHDPDDDDEEDREDDEEDPEDADDPEDEDEDDNEDDDAADPGDDEATPGNVIQGTEAADSLTGSKAADHMRGDRGRDQLSGRQGDDLIEGGGGRDMLGGQKGNDTLIGGKGHDTLKGHAGDDVLEGGAGRDVLRGGAGDDLFVFAGDWGRDVIRDFALGEDEVELVGFDANDITWSARGSDGSAIAQITGGGSIVFVGVTAETLQTDEDWLIL